MNQGDLFEGSFWRVIFWVIFWVIFEVIFLGSFRGSFWGVRCCVAKVLSRNLILFTRNRCGKVVCDYLEGVTTFGYMLRRYRRAQEQQYLLLKIGFV